MDVGLVDVDLDLERVHVDDGADAGAREAAAGRDRRDDLARLRGLGDDDAVERRAHRAITELDLGAAQRRLRQLDLPALRLQLRGERALPGVRQLERLA